MKCQQKATTMIPKELGCYVKCKLQTMHQIQNDHIVTIILYNDTKIKQIVSV